MRQAVSRWLALRCAAAIAVIALCLWQLAPLANASAAALAPALPPDATCAQLAHVSPTATNGPSWGATLLPGHGQAGGWFGVPVCANGVNQAAPGGANVSCAGAPANFRATECAPSAATSDGYGLSFQCVELVVRFSAWAFGSSPGAWRGDAQYLWLAGNHPASFSAIPNGSATQPQPGDILVWGQLDSSGRPWPAGAAGGHVAVVAAVGGGKITFVEQNMLTLRGDIPSETTTLIESGGHWTLGHTYATSGGRALYGWLHSSRNTGQFSGHTAHATPSPSPASHPSAAPTQPPAPSPTNTPAASAAASAAPQATQTPRPVGPALPSLSSGVVVTESGAVAQAVWTDTQAPTRDHTNPSGATPQALVESLGAPPGVTLDPAQTPAVAPLPTGERYIFVRGRDGHLYDAYTAPGQAGALWQTLGAPAGVTLTGSVSAQWDDEGMSAAALGVDGALWLRAGPAGMLGDWVSLGHPASGMLQGNPALVSILSADGATPERVALAIGRDGALYETDGRADGVGAADQPPGWSDWAPVALPGNTPLAPGTLRLVSEPSPADARSTASGVALLASGANGRLWLLRRASVAQPWSAQALALPDSAGAVLGATLMDGDTLQVFVADQRAADTIALGVFHVKEASAAGAPLVGAWERAGVGIASSGAHSPASAAALALGASQSALLAAEGGQLTLTGTPDALRLLAPSAPPSAETISLGRLAAPDASSDDFAGSALDTRWLTSGSPGMSASVAQGALILSAPGVAGHAEALQGAPTGAFTVTTQVAPGAGAATQQAPSTSQGWQAGILLRLDDWNTLSLSERAGGVIALCPTVAGVTQPCMQTRLDSAGSARGVTLRLSASSAGIHGEASVDGAHWMDVGVWNPAWLVAAATAAPGPYAPPLASVIAAGASSDGVRDPSAWLTFTSMALYVDSVGAQSQAQPPQGTPLVAARFAHLTVTSSTGISG
ncbi:MAG TPA: CHAP domain-containing protein [Ktedonobacterales bacterium]